MDCADGRLLFQPLVRFHNLASRTLPLGRVKLVGNTEVAGTGVRVTRAGPPRRFLGKLHWVPREMRTGSRIDVKVIFDEAVQSDVQHADIKR
jgi:hypothetical protein